MHSEFVTTIFAWVAAHPGWMSAFIFLSATAESLTIIGVIIPGALVMFTLGALIGLGHVDFWSAYWWSTLGAILGDAISFWIGRVFQQGIRRLWPFTRHPELITRSEGFFRKHGGKSVLFGRFFGPVRGTIPTVAGMMDMRWSNFMVANVISGVLWAPVYLLPGMAFGASLDIASRVAGRLAIVIVIMVVLLWATAWLVKHAVRLFQTRATDWLQRFTSWSTGRRCIGPIVASLLDPRVNELRGLAMLAALLLGSFILLSLTFSAAGQQLPSSLDQNLYNFFQDLRIPWIDNLMVFTAELGDYQVLLPLSLVVFVWLIRYAHRSATWHWLAALGFGMATNVVFRWLLPVTSPAALVNYNAAYSFPSSHATFSTLVFGFLAVLVARELQPQRRWLAYLAAAFIVVPIAFARLYLGIHWLTDTLAGLCLGMIWVSALGIAYNYHPRTTLRWRSLLMYSVLALLVADTLHVSVQHAENLQRYQPQIVLHTQIPAQWRADGWRTIPQRRLDFRGQQRQPLTLQWASSREDLLERLQGAGWEVVPPLDIKGLLLWLSPQVTLRELPILPQLHNGRDDDLTLMHYGSEPDQRWVLRFWDVGARLSPTHVPIWVGSISRQQLAPRMKLFTFALDNPLIEPPSDLLASAWHGLRTQRVKSANAGPALTLISNASD